MNRIKFSAAAVVLLLATTALAQQKVDDRYPFKTGDIVGFGPNAYPAGATYRVVDCDPIDKPYRECRMIRRAPMAETHERPFTMNNYTGKLELIGHEDGAAGTAPQGSTDAPAADPPTAPQTAPVAMPAAGGACPRSAYGGPVPGTRPATVALFKQKITDSITMAAYGNFWYGVKLDGFTVGTAVANRVSVQPGIGATRVSNGAPPNATLYPVSTTMRVCEGAPNGSSSWRTSQKKYFCFVSKDNEWTCGATN